MIKTIKPRIKVLKSNVLAQAATKRVTGRKLQQMRKKLAIDNCYTCCDCGRVTTEFHREHDYPLHLGGTESEENIRFRCIECHAKKTKEEEKKRR